MLGKKNPRKNTCDSLLSRKSVISECSWKGCHLRCDELPKGDLQKDYG